MKLPFVTSCCLAALLATSAAQVAVEDLGMIAKATETNAALAEQQATASQILKQAEDQANRLQELLKRVGNPAAAPSVAAVTARDIEAGMAAAPGRLKPSAILDAEAAQQDGKRAFDADVGGLFTPIGDTAVSKDGKTTAPRDPEKYKMESAMLSRIEEYQTVRDTALDRKTKLQGELRAALELMATAEDDATVQKQQAMIAVIQGQVASAEKEVDIAKGDIDILKLQIETQLRIQAAGRRENRDAASKALSAMRAAPAATGKTLREVVPWAKKTGN